MKVPFLDLKAQYESIRNEVNPAIQDVLDNTAYVMGKTVFEFEKNFADAHKVKHCLCTSSGTDANHLVLWALGIGPGDEVISTPQTCFASQVGMLHRHAVIRWADIDPETGLICPKSVEKLLPTWLKEAC